MSKQVYMPLDGMLLREIDDCRIGLSKALRDEGMNISMLDGCARKLDDYDARSLGVPVSVHNLKKSTLTIVQYLRMAQMLLDNINDDMRRIWHAREAFSNCVAAQALQNETRE